MRTLLSERDDWIREARALSLTLSDVVRARMNDTPVKVVAIADPALLAELRRHDNNLTQLLRAHHAGLPVDLAAIRTTLDALTAAYRNLLTERR